MKKKINSVLAILAVSLIVTVQFLSPIAAAKKIEIEAGQEDIYNELEEAAKVNAVMNILIKCLASDKYTPAEGTGYTQSGSDVNDAHIFQFPGYYYQRDYSTALWIEDQVQANGGDDGAIYCQQKDGKPLLKVVINTLGVSVADILCYPDGSGRVYKRSGTDSDCQHFTDKGANYVRKKEWEPGLKDFYENWRKASPNKYLPTYDEIGNFNNVDGYFNYLLDFNKYCGYTGTPSTSKGANETSYPITTFTRQDTKIVATKRYYHLSEDKSWENPLSEDNQVTSCSGLLTRIEQLKDTWNEAENRIDDRKYGYSGIILADLEDACKNLKTASGENAYEALRKELEAVETNENASDEDKQKARENLEKLNSITDYVEASGNELDEGGKVYKCVDIEGLKITLEEYHPPSEDIGEEDPVAGETGPTCYDRAASLGWILCPIIEQVADAIQYIYEQIIMPFLELDIGLFASNNATHDVWSKIRDMANIGFIIFFIFVIFSQLTGVGIDNYGIKKVLPKLIVGAILINLSYVICQLSVDLSNILGYGIKSIFEGLAPNIDEITVAQEGAFGTGNTHSVAGTFILLIGIVAAITAAAILALGPHILIPVFLGLISIVIAIIFCFILLAVRKAFAVLLVIISPLAFMCYILPNTKSLFDKWFNAFKAMLLAFPICSAMIYGGQFVGSLLIDAADATNVPFTLALCAAVISVMPVFMIPKVIRGSMAMISNGLTRMQGSLTSRARGAAAHGLNNSRMMTRYDQNRAAKRAARQTAYNAKKGQRYIDRQNRKGNADLTKMSPAARAAYLNAQGGVDAQDKQMQDAWSTKFSEMERGDEERANSLIEMANNGKLDKNALIAGMSSISDSDQMTRAFNAIHGSANGKALLKDSKTRSAVAGSLKSSKSVINQSMGKLVAKSPDGTFTHGELRDKVQGAGTSVMASQDKDTFKSEGAMDLFSKEQLAAGMGAGYSGADAAAFSQMMMGDETKAAEALSTMSASQVAGMSTDMFKSKEEGGMGSEFIKNNVSKDAINTLNSEDGARLRANMNADVKKALGITGDGGSSSESTPAPAPENDGGGSTGGGWVDDSGNPITSPAQLTDDDLRYANKLKEMSQRGSDGSTLSVDHDSSSATSEPMRGEHGRGINDATGKERAVEGNRLDYHPRMKGETNADYSARAQWEKEMARRAEAAGPRDSAKETTPQWQTRAGIESFESWRGKQNK